MHMVIDNASVLNNPQSVLESTMVYPPKWFSDLGLDQGFVSRAAAHLPVVSDAGEKGKMEPQ